MADAPTHSQLTTAIAEASRRAFTDLFARHPEHFYYCALVTTGEGHAPVISAWSTEALATSVSGSNDADRDRTSLKWSYGQSPYFCYGSEHFSEVNRLFGERPAMVPDLPEDEWLAEWDLRLAAMESAMSILDAEGIFGTGHKRLEVAVLVEVVPPDSTNTERAMRLNPPDALREWLAEAAERD